MLVGTFLVYPPGLSLSRLIMVLPWNGHGGLRKLGAHPLVQWELRQHKNHTDASITAFTSSGQCLLPAGTRLLSMGDSLSRYQYMDLAYMLRGTDLTEYLGPENPLEEPTWTSWRFAFAGTNRALHPQERCDCYRADSRSLHNKPTGEYHIGQIMENRQIVMPECSASITFAFANGHVMPTGHTLPPEEWRPWDDKTYRASPIWRVRSWEEGLRKQLMPTLRPNTIILGLARMNRLDEMRAIVAIVRAAMPDACIVLRLEPLRGNVPNMNHPRKGKVQAEARQLAAAFPNDTIFNAPRVLHERLGRPLAKRDFFYRPRNIHFTTASGINHILNRALLEEIHAECPAWSNKHNSSVASKTV